MNPAVKPRANGAPVRHAGLVSPFRFVSLLTFRALKPGAAHDECRAKTVHCERIQALTTHDPLSYPSTSGESFVKKSHLIAFATASLLASGAAFADDCATEIEGNDVMQFNKASITVPASCKDFTVTLKHVGKMPKTTMGHNWVLTKPADQKNVIKEGIAAGPAKDYVDAEDAKIIAHTKLIGGGESTSVTFPVSKLAAGETYAYFCNFPGHAAIMKGTLSVK
jgi:azurin